MIDPDKAPVIEMHMLGVDKHQLAGGDRISRYLGSTHAGKSASGSVVGHTGGAAGRNSNRMLLPGCVSGCRSTINLTSTSGCDISR